MKSLSLMCVSLGWIAFAMSAGAAGQVARFPSTPFPPGVNFAYDPSVRNYRIAADDLAVRVDGVKVEVRRARVSEHSFNRVWPGHQRSYDQTEPATYLAFEKDGGAGFEVCPTWPVTNVIVRPLSAGIRPRVNGGTIAFETPGPGFYVVEFDGRHRAFHVFQEPQCDFAEYGEPTRVFGPGMHVVGTLDVSSGERIYIDRNAIVYGRFRGQGVEDVKIFGAGVIDGSVCERVFDSGYTPLQNHGIGFFNSKRIVVDGPVLFNCAYWCTAFFNCEDVDVAHLKIVGQWRYNTDGIDICNSRRVRVRDSFVRSFDDAVCVKGVLPFADHAVEDVSVERCVLWCEWGKTCEIGVETHAPHMRRISFADCDLIHNSAVALDVACGGKTKADGIVFSRMRVEFQADTEPMVYQSSDAMSWNAAGRRGRPALIAVNTHPYGKNGGGATIGKVEFHDIRACREPGVPEPAVNVRAGIVSPVDVRHVDAEGLR